MEFAEKICSELLPLLPSGWTKAICRGILTPGSAELYFFCRRKGDSRYIRSHELIGEGVFRAPQMYLAYRNIAKAAQSERENAEGDPWCSFTFTMYDRGDFSFDYEYEPEARLTFEEWKDKYLI